MTHGVVADREGADQRCVWRGMYPSVSVSSEHCGLDAAGCPSNNTRPHVAAAAGQGDKGNNAQGRVECERCVRVRCLVCTDLPAPVVSPLGLCAVATGRISSAAAGGLVTGAVCRREQQRLTCLFLLSFADILYCCAPQCLPPPPSALAPLRGLGASTESRTKGLGQKAFLHLTHFSSLNLGWLSCPLHRPLVAVARSRSRAVSSPSCSDEAPSPRRPHHHRLLHRPRSNNSLSGPALVLPLHRPTHLMHKY
jgi:hypothetical protein